MWYNIAIFHLFRGTLFSLRNHRPRVSKSREKVPLQPEGAYLGRFDLNGHSFKAYECDSDENGTQLRLTSFPAVTTEQEAAVIRYIVNEGLVEIIWPEMGKEIVEEANWAFFRFPPRSG
jgi:hypothetical protein